MIDYLEALDIIEEKSPRPSAGSEVPLREAFGRVLSRAVVSDVSLPPFHKATMDGFAVRSGDIEEVPAVLRVIGDVPAGVMPEFTVGPGEAASVMTGAPVPKGADAVVMVEWTSGFGARSVTVNRGVGAGTNISPPGDIVREGETVVEAGTRIGVETSSLLAMAGCDPVPVWDLPKVGVVSTGGELVPATVTPGPAQIRDCNGPALVAFCREMGLEPLDLGRVGDDVGEITEVLKRGLACDLLLVSGGVSAGAYDFVADVLVALGVETHFHRVAVKPGKPIVFGTRDGKMVFGVPGNPVSAMVVARVFINHALHIRMGLGPRRPVTVRARLKADLTKKPDRLWFVPATVSFGDEVTVVPLKNRGSADLPASARANALVVGLRGTAHIEGGTMVDVVVWERSLRS